MRWPCSAMRLCSDMLAGGLCTGEGWPARGVAQLPRPSQMSTRLSPSEAEGLDNRELKLQKL